MATSLARAMIVVGLLTTAVAAAAIPARATYGAQVSVDEPQYLLTAISLGEDFDLDISDEIAAERFLPFHELALNPQTMELNDSGLRLSPHDPLLPALLAVPMRVGGWRLAKATLAMVAGLLAALTLWVAVRRFDVGLLTASVTVAGFATSPPLTTYGTQVYPEIPAALATMAAIAALTGPLGTGAVAVVAIAVVALPWLSIKYALVAAALAATGVVRLYREDNTRRALTLSGALAVAGVIYLLFHRQVYGGWTVFAAGDHFIPGEFSVVGFEPDYWGRSKRIYGILVDRGFGLVAWAPAYLISVAAVGAFLRQRPRSWHVLVVPLAAGWATATWVAFTMHGWWWPGRQVVVVLPIVVLLTALFLDQSRKLLGAYAILAAATVGNWLWLVVEASTDRRALVVDFEATNAPMYWLWHRLLPDHHRWPDATMLISMLWVVALAALLYAGWRRAATPG